MGIASTSVSSRAAGAAPAAGRDPALEFLELCAGLGAGGIQAQISGDPARLRARAEELGMYVEGMAPLPRDGATAAFEASLEQAAAAGALCVRIAALSGRRYETFATAEEWNRWREPTLAALRSAVSLAEKRKMPLALENHKDWTLEEMKPLLERYSSEYLGVCLDFGNNIALLDDPMEVVEQLAPHAFSTHLKDMGVRPYEDGFLLSEVVLGQGMLDLPRMVERIRKARPHCRFTLEMITRDPLRVPCLTDRYWGPLPERNGIHLARTLRLVQSRASGVPLPEIGRLAREEQLRIEEENIKACLEYARQNLAL
jgi:sugar phosphate isomerase/epimerase